MRRTASVLLVCSLGLVGGSRSAAVDIFVNNRIGNDTANGRAAQAVAGDTGPVRTIAKALRLADQGDQVVLANTGEPYRECMSLAGLKHSGFGSHPFVILGNGATLDGTESVPERAWEHHHDDVFRFRPRGLAWQMLYRDGRPLRQYPVSRLRPSLPNLGPLEWCLYDGYIWLRVEKGKHPLNYKLSHAALPTGITCYGVENVALRDLVVQGFRFDGVAVADRGRDVRLSGVTLRGNGRSGLSVGGASRALLDHSLVGDNGDAQVRVEAPARLSVAQSDVIGGAAPAYHREGGRLVIDGQPPAE